MLSVKGYFYKNDLLSMSEIGDQKMNRCLSSTRFGRSKPRFYKIHVFYAFPSALDQRQSSYALVYLPRLEAAIPFGALLFLFLTDVDRGGHAWSLRTGDRAKCDEWLR